jgi:hypothetical protein
MNHSGHHLLSVRPIRCSFSNLTPDTAKLCRVHANVDESFVCTPPARECDRESDGDYCSARNAISTIARCQNFIGTMNPLESTTDRDAVSSVPQHGLSRLRAY